MKFRALFLAILLALPGAASAQQVMQQAGPWVTGHVPVYTYYPSPTVIDSGTAAGGPTGTGFIELGLQIRGSGSPPYQNAGKGPDYTNLCDYDGPTTGPYHFLCFGPNTNGGGLIEYGYALGATPGPLSFKINGVTYTIPDTGFGTVTGPTSSVDGDIAVWDGTTGTKLKDGGLPPVYTAGTGLLLSNNQFSVDSSKVATLSSSNTLASAITHSSLTSLGTVANGTWQGDPIADSYIASAATWNAKLDNITGLITEGSNVTITGSGTAADPYEIASSGSGGGGVSSVGLSAPALFTVSGSPVTSSGTLTLSYSGSALPTANGGTGNTSGTVADFTGDLSGDVTGTQSATVVGAINGVSMSGLATGIVKNTTSTGKPSIAVAADFPTLNQNTTGTAAGFTGDLSGDVTGTQSATVVGAINGVSMSGLATGIVKNTTSTGKPSIAVAADFPTLNQSTTGNAATATKLATARAINGVNFDGTAAITVPAAAGTLTGSSLASGVTASSLTSVGTIGTGTWQGSAIADSYIASAATWNAKLSDITGLITEGSNVTITGSGTSGDPYVIASSGSGGGGVSSVGLSAPSIFSVSGSPVTSSGTLALSYSGTALPIANGGTAATSAGGALTSLGAAASGTNADITAMSALATVSSSPTFSSSITVTGSTTLNGPLILSVTAPTGSTLTLTSSSGHFECLTPSSGGVAVTLSATTTGTTWFIKDCKGTAGTSNDTLTPSSGKIDGATSYTLNANYQGVSVTYDGTNYWIN